MIEEHTAATNSAKGRKILDNFESYLPKFKKIIPHDYKKITEEIAAFEGKGLSEEQARIEAFYSLVGER